MSNRPTVGLELELITWAEAASRDMACKRKCWCHMTVDRTGKDVPICAKCLHQHCGQGATA